MVCGDIPRETGLAAHWAIVVQPIIYETGDRVRLVATAQLGGLPLTGKARERGSGMASVYRPRLGVCTSAHIIVFSVNHVYKRTYRMTQRFDACTGNRGSASAVRRDYGHP